MTFPRRVFASEYYLYLEATGNINQTAKIESHTYQGGEYCVDFYMLMFGKEIGSLKLNAVSGPYVENAKTWTGDQGTGTTWIHQRLDIFVHTSKTFNVRRFETDII